MIYLVYLSCEDIKSKKGEASREFISSIFKDRLFQDPIDLVIAPVFIRFQDNLIRMDRSDL